MLSTDTYQTQIMTRLKPIVKELFREHHLFEEKLNETEQIENLTNIFAKNLTPDVFNHVEDLDLKQRCSKILTTEAFAGFFDDFTPEELAIFEEAIKRK